MAARFPQSGSAISGYQIPAALVTAGVKVVCWAAGADAVHVLLAGETSTTVLTRTPATATFNSTDGRITGTVSGNGTSQYFALSVAGGTMVPQTQVGSFGRFLLRSDWRALFTAPAYNLAAAVIRLPAS